MTNNAGGELRLADGQTVGAFLSQPFRADYAFNVAVATWRAEVVPGTSLGLELRARATPPDGDPCRRFDSSRRPCYNHGAA